MGWLYFVLALALLGLNDYFVYKYGQKSIAKIVEEEHRLVVFVQGERSKVATLVQKVKTAAAIFHK